MKRYVSVLLIIAAIGLAWYLTTPREESLKTAKPLTAYNQGLSAGEPMFIMFTSDG